ncbi:hatching enzyme 1.2-like [Hydractinia symbiolongicarpus]|uniref:hatching enzyme 1.2-like n=1 Tax=Hydractinia symbiolongicarpus TaxID=13093 RepID=UPI00254EA10D|nr:hatching enzyme 1.2-like [Hydractinia symbiolongicarpus]
MAFRLVVVVTLTMCAYVASEWVEEMENPGLFEGDMILSPQQLEAARKGKLSYATTIGKQWPGKTVPYAYDLTIKARPRAIKVIQDAIAEYHDKTCIKFKERTNEANYIMFYQGGGCSSYVGFKGGPTMPMKVSLAPGCWRKGIVIHELAHALGVYHEQSRPDRDGHVEIQWQNIKQGMDFNFKKQATSKVDSLGTDYDYESIMHYGKTAFAKTRGLVTIKTKDPSKQDVIGRRTGFSAIDVIQMNRLYNCGSGPIPTKQTTNPVVTQSPTGSAGCKDGSPACPGWKSICQSHPHIAQICKKTCNLC